jgi:hypothetical protein
MIPLKLVLQSVEKGLKVLARKTEEMQAVLDKLTATEVDDRAKRGPEDERTVARGGAGTSARQRPTKKGRKTSRAGTATDAVLEVIRKNKGGATTAQIRAATGFSDQKIWSIVNRAKKQGKVKSEKRGVYRLA